MVGRAGAEADDDSGQVIVGGRLNVLASVVSTPLAAPVIAAMCVLTPRVESCPHSNADRWHYRLALDVGTGRFELPIS